jgi:hypothetical protein
MYKKSLIKVISEMFVWAKESVSVWIRIMPSYSCEPQVQIDARYNTDNNNMRSCIEIGHPDLMLEKNLKATILVFLLDIRVATSILCRACCWDLAVTLTPCHSCFYRLA